MRFKMKEKCLWHLWFAWHPVKTENNEWVWLEHVERRWNPRTMYRYVDCSYEVFCGIGWRYR